MTTRTPEDRQVLTQKVTKAYAAGHSIRDIAEAHAVSYGKIRALLLEAGVPMRRRGGNNR